MVKRAASLYYTVLYTNMETERYNEELEENDMGENEQSRKGETRDVADWCPWWLTLSTVECYVLFLGPKNYAIMWLFA